MSRVGKKLIPVPAGVIISVEGSRVSVKGSKGELSRTIPAGIRAIVRGGEVTVEPGRAGKDVHALWGLARSLVANMVEGVTKGFEKKLEVEGIGYRVVLEGKDLVLQLGFSHPVRVSAPPGVSFSVEKNVISVSGADKERVGETAAYIRSLRPPEPYKGKGIRYAGEVIRRKVGKKAVTSA